MRIFHFGALLGAAPHFFTFGPDLDQAADCLGSRKTAEAITRKRRGASVPRLRARRFTPAGFSFVFAGRGKLLTLPFMPMLLGRGRCNRREKSGGPPLLEPSLKV
jgi:hypothetical protein